jgi:5-methylcytosine-specific restriction endonuclease McrA
MSQKRVVCLVCGHHEVDRAHIKTRGAGGSDKRWNIMELCRVCHTEQHKIGLIKFILKYPDVKTALERKGWTLERVFGRTRLYHPNEIMEIE